MARSGTRTPERTVITAARHPRSLDVETRQRRYLVTMLIRTACFVGVVLVPGLWLKIACALAAAVIPPFAVMLANNSDNHASPVPDHDSEVTHRALPAGHVIPGSVEPDDPVSPAD